MSELLNLDLQLVAQGQRRALHPLQMGPCRYLQHQDLVRVLNQIAQPMCGLQMQLHLVASLKLWFRHLQLDDRSRCAVQHELLQLCKSPLVLVNKLNQLECDRSLHQPLCSGLQLHIRDHVRLLIRSLDLPSHLALQCEDQDCELLRLLELQHLHQ